jgi:autotransporter-associated beta strand protein
MIEGVPMAGGMQTKGGWIGRASGIRALNLLPRAFGLCVFASLIQGVAMGQTTLYWGTAGAGGSGDATATNAWWNGTAQTTWNTSNVNLVFQGTAGTVALGNNRTAQDIQFNTAGYTFAFGIGANQRNLTLSSLSGTELGSTTFVGNSTETSGFRNVDLVTSTGANVTFTGTIANNGLGSTTRLVKSGAGRLILGSGFQYTAGGSLTVNNGALQLGTATGVPVGRQWFLSASGANPVVLELAAGDFGATFSQTAQPNSSDVRMTGGTVGFAAIGGDRTLTMANSNDVGWGVSGATDRFTASELILATAASTGKLTFASSSKALRLSNTVAGLVQRTVRVDNGSSAIDAEISLQLLDGTVASGAIGQLVKVGDGVLSLSRAAGNGYTGGTIVRGGTLLVNNTSNSGVGSGAVTVDAGGFLGGTGRVSGAVTADGGIAPGSTGIGTLTTGSGVTWNAGNSWLFQLGASAPSLAAATAGTDSDLLAVSTAFTKGTAGSFTFDFGNSGADGWYKLVDYASTTFASGDFQATNVPSGKTANFVVDPDSTALYVQIVPEPGMLALAGLGMGMATLSFMKCRRRA